MAKKVPRVSYFSQSTVAETTAWTCSDTAACLKCLDDKKTGKQDKGGGGGGGDK